MFVRRLPVPVIALDPRRQCGVDAGAKFRLVLALWEGALHCLCILRKAETDSVEIAVHVSVCFFAWDDEEEEVEGEDYGEDEGGRPANAAEGGVTKRGDGARLRRAGPAHLAVEGLLVRSVVFLRRFATRACAPNGGGGGGGGAVADDEGCDDYAVRACVRALRAGALRSAEGRQRVWSA